MTCRRVNPNRFPGLATVHTHATLSRNTVPMARSAQVLESPLAWEAQPAWPQNKGQRREKESPPRPENLRTAHTFLEIVVHCQVTELQPPLGVVIAFEKPFLTVPDDLET